ncbi:MAG: hypothetical protein ACI89X_002487 [Planctomycetota bacterium]|jgi:hypothetical protein
MVLIAVATASCDAGVVHRTADGQVYARGAEKRHIGYGRWTKLPTDGTRDTALMTKGSLDGIWKQFFVDGRIKSSATLQAGVFDGPSTVWHPSGVKALQGSYRAGQRDGPWFVWDASGKLNETMSGYYRNGALVGGI